MIPAAEASNSRWPALLARFVVWFVSFTLVHQISLEPPGVVRNEAPRLRRINVKPRKETKMMMLAGQKPSTIMEICYQGMALHENQVKEEVRFLRKKVASMEDKLEQLKQYNKQVVLHFKAEITRLELELEEARGKGSSTTGFVNMKDGIFSPPTKEFAMVNFDYLEEQHLANFGMEQSGFGSSSLRKLVASANGMEIRGIKRSRFSDIDLAKPYSSSSLGTRSTEYRWPTNGSTGNLF